MLTRRELSSLALTAAASAFARPALSYASSPASRLEFGVQLYSVRDIIGDLPATLHLIRQIGYSSVETFSGMYDQPAKALKKTINEAGLHLTSGHFDYETLDARVDYAKELGLQHMICPVIPQALWDAPDGFHNAAEHLNTAAMKAHSVGLHFGYHPHNYEFKRRGSGRGFDILMRELDPAIRVELDIYWAVEAGENPLKLMQQQSSRLALIHIKDRKPTPKFSFELDEQASHFTEAGKGTIDWKSVLAQARQLGVTQFFVDQDASDIPVDQSLRDNWKYLSQLVI